MGGGGGGGAGAPWGPPLNPPYANFSPLPVTVTGVFMKLNLNG